MKTLEATGADQPVGLEPPPAPARRQPHARWPYRWLAAGGVAIAASFFWPPLGARPALVLLGQDQRVWSWIIAVGGGIAVGAALLGIAHNLGRNHDAWWQGLLLTLFSSVVVVALCVASVPALVIAALSFGDSYRDLGNAHGDGIVVALHPSNGYDDSTITFGTRHGAWVDFDPATRRIVARNASLDDWSFALRTTATTMQVRYSPTSGSRATEVVTLTRMTATSATARPGTGPLSNTRSSIGRVGSNKRYADSLQRRRHNREAEHRALVPRSLTEAERGTDIRSGPGVPVRAWVTVGDTPVQILGSAVEWTSRAVLVIWPGADDTSRSAWVWASAVDRIDP